MKKELSIIIPCYNVEKYIRRCIDSLVAQSYPIELTEWILIDDASTDSTWQIITDLEKTYPDTIIAIHCTRNGRQGQARNIGLEYASGTYVGYVDSDDWVEPDMYSIMVNEIKHSDSELVFCRFYRDDGRHHLTHQLDGSIQRYKIANDDERNTLIVSNILGYGVWDKIYRRDFLNKNNISFPIGLAYEDIFFSSQYYLYVEHFSVINYELYHYFVNSNSTVLCNNASYHYDMLEIIRRRIDFYVELGALHQFRNALTVDLFLSGYVAVYKIMFLRFDTVPYDMYLQLQELYRNNNILPDIKCTEAQVIPDKYEYIYELIPLSLSETQLNDMAPAFRKIFT